MRAQSAENFMEKAVDCCVDLQAESQSESCSFPSVEHLVIGNTRNFTLDMSSSEPKLCEAEAGNIICVYFYVWEVLLQYIFVYISSCRNVYIIQLLIYIYIYIYIILSFLYMFVSCTM